MPIVYVVGNGIGITKRGERLSDQAIQGSFPSDNSVRVFKTEAEAAAFVKSKNPNTKPPTPDNPMYCCPIFKISCSSPPNASPDSQFIPPKKEQVNDGDNSLRELRGVPLRAPTTHITYMVPKTSIIGYLWATLPGVSSSEIFNPLQKPYMEIWGNSSLPVSQKIDKSLLTLSKARHTPVQGKIPRDPVSLFSFTDMERESPSGNPYLSAFCTVVGANLADMETVLLARQFEWLSNIRTWLLLDIPGMDKNVVAIIATYFFHPSWNGQIKFGEYNDEKNVVEYKTPGADVTAFFREPVSLPKAAVYPKRPALTVTTTTTATTAATAATPPAAASAATATTTATGATLATAAIFRPTQGPKRPPTASTAPAPKRPGLGHS